MLASGGRMSFLWQKNSEIENGDSELSIIQDDDEKKKIYFGKKSQIVRLLDRNYQQRKCDLFQGKLRQKNATLEEFHRWHAFWGTLNSVLNILVAHDPFVIVVSIPASYSGLKASLVLKTALIRCPKCEIPQTENSLRHRYQQHRKFLIRNLCLIIG